MITFEFNIKMAKLFEDYKTLEKKFKHIKKSDLHYIYFSGYNTARAMYTDKVLQTLKELGNTKEGRHFLEVIQTNEFIGETIYIE